MHDERPSSSRRELTGLEGIGEAGRSQLGREARHVFERGKDAGWIGGNLS